MKTKLEIKKEIAESINKLIRLLSEMNYGTAVLIVFISPLIPVVLLLIKILISIKIIKI